MERQQRNEYNNFPFIRHKETVNYIKQSKIMFIMRGLPGSGKTTLASEIAARYPGAVKCSADDFFTTSKGRYDFNHQNLVRAHEQCHSKAEKACQSAANVVIIDNTNIQYWEMEFYVDLAAKENYIVVVVIPSTPWCFNPSQLAKQNKHHLTKENIDEKLRTYQNFLPFYWGWFLNEDDSDKLAKLTRKYFTLCMMKIPRFCQDMKRLHFENNDRSYLGYDEVYGRHNASMETFHCTTFYNGSRESTSGGIAYSKRRDVCEAIGQVYVLHVIGIIITPRTISGRVALTKDEMNLWERSEDEFVPSRDQGEAGASAVVDDLTSRFRRSSLRSGHYENLSQRRRFMPLSGVGSQAHVSVAWASNCQAKQTGLDHSKIMELEDEWREKPQCTRLGGATARYYGTGQCVVYLNKPLDINALFSGKY